MSKFLSDNPNCDGGFGANHSVNPQVRVLPTGGDSNLIVCRLCYQKEINFRRERNLTLSDDAKFDLPSWESLKVYTNS